MAAPSGDVPTTSDAESAPNQFPLMKLPDKALKLVISYLNLPLRMKIRFCKRLRDLEARARKHIYSLQIIYCAGNFVMLVMESKSDEERMMNKMREKQASGELDGVTMESILNADDEEDDVVPFDYSKTTYGICFNSEERISVLHNFLRSLDTAKICRFELDTWVSPYFYDDIMWILQEHCLQIDQLILRSTTDQKSLYDTMGLDKGIAVGYEMASVNHDNRMLTDEFVDAFVYDKEVFHSYILHSEVTATVLHEVYKVIAEGECSLADFLLFVNISELREMRKLMGVKKVKDGYKTTQENIEMFKTPRDLHFIIGLVHVHLGSYFARNPDNYGPVHIKRVKNSEEFNEEKEKWDKVQFL